MDIVYLLLIQAHKGNRAVRTWSEARRSFSFFVPFGDMLKNELRDSVIYALFEEASSLLSNEAMDYTTIWRPIMATG